MSFEFVDNVAMRQFTGFIEAGVEYKIFPHLDWTYKKNFTYSTTLGSTFTAFKEDGVSGEVVGRFEKVGPAKKPEDKVLKDSGERVNYDTGAVRDIVTGKGRFDLLPAYAIQRLARHYEKGSIKYGDRNWEKGIPLGRYMDSALRHLFNHLDGQRDEDHLAAALWNVVGLIETEERIRRGVLPETLNTLQSAKNLHQNPEVPK